MYYNVIKRNLKTNEFIEIVKTFNVHEFENFMYAKVDADDYCRLRNRLSRIFKKYYYKVELDHE